MGGGLDLGRGREDAQPPTSLMGSPGFPGNPQILGRHFSFGISRGNPSCGKSSRNSRSLEQASFFSAFPGVFLGNSEFCAFRIVSGRVFFPDPIPRARSILFCGIYIKISRIFRLGDFSLTLILEFRPD